MILRATILATMLALPLAGCGDVVLPERGFATHYVLGASRPAAAAPCEGAACSPAPGFCIARGYTPNTQRYAICIRSVEENLRAGR